MSPLTTQMFIQNIDQIDCALFYPKIGIVGHSWTVDLYLQGPIKENGFICDFSIVKKLAKKALKHSFDHTLLVDSSAEVALQGSSEHWTLDDVWSYRCPEGAVYQLNTLDMGPNVLAKELSKFIEKELNIKDVAATVVLRDEKPSDSAFYYTHGIPGHTGMCQRPFHGHSSSLKIEVNQQRKPLWERKFLDEVFSKQVHLTSPFQLVDAKNWRVGEKGRRGDVAQIAYAASLGEYQISLPADQVFNLPTETSIECMTQFIAEYVDRTYKPDGKIRVSCKEGIHKGAIVEI